MKSVTEAEKQIGKLTKKLGQAETIISFQKKFLEMFGGRSTAWKNKSRYFRWLAKTWAPPIRSPQIRFASSD